MRKQHRIIAFLICLFGYLCLLSHVAVAADYAPYFTSPQNGTTIRWADRIVIQWRGAPDATQVKIALYNKTEGYYVEQGIIYPNNVIDPRQNLFDFGRDERIRIDCLYTIYLSGMDSLGNEYPSQPIDIFLEGSMFQPTELSPQDYDVYRLNRGVWVSWNYWNVDTYKYRITVYDETNNKYILDNHYFETVDDDSFYITPNLLQEGNRYWAEVTGVHPISGQEYKSAERATFQIWSEPIYTPTIASPTVSVIGASNLRIQWDFGRDALREVIYTVRELNSGNYIAYRETTSVRVKIISESDLIHRERYEITIVGLDSQRNEYPAPTKIVTISKKDENKYRPIISMPVAGSTVGKNGLLVTWEGAEHCYSPKFQAPLMIISVRDLDDSRYILTDQKFYGDTYTVSDTIPGHRYRIQLGGVSPDGTIYYARESVECTVLNGKDYVPVIKTPVNGFTDNNSLTDGIYVRWIGASDATRLRLSILNETDGDYLLYNDEFSRSADYHRILPSELEASSTYRITLSGIDASNNVYPGASVRVSTPRAKNYVPWTVSPANEQQYASGENFTIRWDYDDARDVRVFVQSMSTSQVVVNEIVKAYEYNYYVRAAMLKGGGLFKVLLSGFDRDGNEYVQSEATYFRTPGSEYRPTVTSPASNSLVPRRDLVITWAGASEAANVSLIFKKASSGEYVIPRQDIRGGTYTIPARYLELGERYSIELVAFSMSGGTPYYSGEVYVSVERELDYVPIITKPTSSGTVMLGSSVDIEWTVGSDAVLHRIAVQNTTTGKMVVPKETVAGSFYRITPSKLNAAEGDCFKVTIYGYGQGGKEYPCSSPVIFSVGSAGADYSPVFQNMQGLVDFGNNVTIHWSGAANASLVLLSVRNLSTDVELIKRDQVSGNSFVLRAAEMQGKVSKGDILKVAIAGVDPSGKEYWNPDTPYIQYGLDEGNILSPSFGSYVSGENVQVTWEGLAHTTNQGNYRTIVQFFDKTKPNSAPIEIIKQGIVHSIEQPFLAASEYGLLIGVEDLSTGLTVYRAETLFKVKLSIEELRLPTSLYQGNTHQLRGIIQSTADIVVGYLEIRRDSSPTLKVDFPLGGDPRKIDLSVAAIDNEVTYNTLDIGNYTIHVYAKDSLNDEVSVSGSLKINRVPRAGTPRANEFWVQVIDVETQTQIKGASVSIGGITEITNDEGIAFFSDISNRKQEHFTVTSAGFKPFSTQRDIIAGSIDCVLMNPVNAVSINSAMIAFVDVLKYPYLPFYKTDSLLDLVTRVTVSADWGRFSPGLYRLVQGDIAVTSTSGMFDLSFAREFSVGSVGLQLLTLDGILLKEVGTRIRIYPAPENNNSSGNALDFGGKKSMTLPWPFDSLKEIEFGFSPVPFKITYDESGDEIEIEIGKYEEQITAEKMIGLSKTPKKLANKPSTSFSALLNRMEVGIAGHGIGVRDPKINGKFSAGVDMVLYCKQPFSFRWYYLFPVVGVPFTTQINGSLGIEGKVSGEVSVLNGKIEDFQLGATVSPSAEVVVSAGPSIGIAELTAGGGGKYTAEVNIGENSFRHFINWLIELKLRVGFWNADPLRFSFADVELGSWSWDKDGSPSTSEADLRMQELTNAMSSMFDLSALKLIRSQPLLATLDGVPQMEYEPYANSLLQSVKVGNNLYEFYLAVAPDRDLDENKPVLVYRKNGTVTPVHDDGTADSNFDVIASGDNIIVVWQNNNVAHPEGEDIENILNSIEVSAAVLVVSDDNISVELLGDLIHNNVPSLHPVVATNGETAKFAWFDNAPGDLFGTSEGEAFIRSVQYNLNTKAFSDITVEHSTTFPIVSLGLIWQGGQYKTSYILPSSSDPGQFGDLSLYIDGVMVARGILSDIVSGKISDSDVIAWYADSNIDYTFDGTVIHSVLAEENSNVGHSFAFITDGSETRVIWSQVSAFDELGGQNTSLVYAVNLVDKEDNIWSNPYVVAEETGVIHRPSGYFSEGEVILSYGTESEMDGQGYSNVSLNVLRLQEQANIVIEDIEYEKGIANEGRIELIVVLANKGTRDASNLQISVVGSSTGTVFDQTIECAMPVGSVTDVHVAVQLPSTQTLEQLTVSVNSADEPLTNTDSKVLIYGEVDFALQSDTYYDDGIHYERVIVSNRGSKADAMLRFRKENQFGDILLEYSIDSLSSDQNYSVVVDIDALAGVGQMNSIYVSVDSLVEDAICSLDNYAVIACGTGFMNALSEIAGSALLSNLRPVVGDILTVDISEITDAGEYSFIWNGSGDNTLSSNYVVTEEDLGKPISVSVRTDNSRYFGEIVSEQTEPVQIGQGWLPVQFDDAHRLDFEQWVVTDVIGDSPWIFWSKNVSTLLVDTASDDSLKFAAARLRNKTNGDIAYIGIERVEHGLLTLFNEGTEALSSITELSISALDSGYQLALEGWKISKVVGDIDYSITDNGILVVSRSEEASLGAAKIIRLSDGAVRVIGIEMGME